MKILKLSLYFIIILVTSFGLISLQSCENNPSDLGLEFILSDTLGTIVLNSNTDSMQISSNNYKRFVNNYNSGYFMVGKYQGYESKSFLRFNNISPDYDSATVISAKIKIHYAKYAFQDTLGNVSFNIYGLNNKYNFTSITNDSINSGSIGTTSLGNYSGNPLDTNAILIPLDNNTAKNWLEYAADTSYASKNYGVALVPNSSSTTIKAFGSVYNSSPNLYPQLVIVVSKNSKTDTITYYAETLSLTNNLTPITIADRFILQNGISYNNILNFDISKLPGKVTINEAYIRLKLDRANSYIFSNSGQSFVFSMVTDSAAKTNDGLTFSAIQEDSVTYTIRLNNIFQKWNYNPSSNLGVQVKNNFDAINLDKFVFFNSAVQDTSKRPKLIIRYTPRG